MTRFVAPDLAALGDVPAVVPVDFDAIRAERAALLVEAFQFYGVSYDVAELETDPLVIGFARGGGVREATWRQMLNEAIRAVMTATAIGGDLDHIGATFAGIARLVYPNAADDQPPASQWDPVRGKWVELDATFRDRIALAFEAFSVAGPEGAYVHHALELDGVRDIADAVAYSEEDSATYSAVVHADAYSRGKRPTPFAARGAGAPVLAPEVLVVVLPTLTYAGTAQALVDRTFAALSADDVRPCGDNVRVEIATQPTYAIDVTLYYLPGADVAALKAAAEKRLAAYAVARRRMGALVQPEVIGGRAAIDDGVTVEVTSPAAEIVPGPKGAATCTGITVRPVQARGTWSD